jgi:RND superfamily putative drug exporter
MSTREEEDHPLGVLARTARWTTQHRRTVLGGWVVALVVALGASHAVGANFSNSLSLPGTQSQRAVDLLQRDFPTESGDQDQIVFAVSQGSVTSAAVRARIERVLARVARLPHVSDVVSPYSSRGAHQIAAGGSVGFARVIFDEQARTLPHSAIKRVIATAGAAAQPSLQVALGGQAIELTERPSLGPATAVGLLAAIIILLLTFGSALAMGLPILTALLGLGTGIGLAGLGSQLIEVPDFATELAAMIGLGVGIDYALFILTRFRENLRSGMAVAAAVAGAMDTAGRAVLFAGATVILALLGQLLLGVAFLDGLAVASALAVLTTMLAALTVLPALLSRFGERIGRPSRRARRPTAAAPRSGAWLRWSQLIARHPWPGALAGLAIMLTLAVPALSLRLGASDAGNDPSNLTTRHAYDLLARGFGPGFDGPLQIVVSLPRAADSTALHTISDALAGTGDVASVSAPRLSPAGTTAVLDVYPRSSPQSSATTNLVERLRQSALPRAERSTATTILVGGSSATEIDFTHVLASKLPLFIAVVLVLSALLLLVVFRSVVIPLQAAAMNILSIGASLGTIVAVFQWGWLGSLFGVNGGPIEAFLPVILFAIVFGLSMDYEVFIISRIHEEWSRHRDPAAAIHRGVASTGRVITAAAAIMICVFLSFVFGDLRALKLFGLSLASAVFLDAFVVRSLLLPSVLHLLGERAWWMPTWLERRVPRFAIEQKALTLAPLEDSP